MSNNRHTDVTRLFAGNLNETAAREIFANHAIPELYARLKALRADGAAGEVRLANFVRDNPYEVAFGTAGGIAARCDVSSSYVVRFAQDLGFAGFTQMRDFSGAPCESKPRHLCASTYTTVNRLWKLTPSVSIISIGYCADRQ